MQNSGVFSQYPGQQSMQRQAFMSPVQGNIGESPQIQFFNYREETPMMMQGSSQSQSVRSERQFPAPSDQGRSSVVWGIPNSYLIRYIINTHLNRHRLGVD